MADLSQVSLVGAMMDLALAALDRLAEERGLSPGEIDQRAAYEELRDAARAAAPAALGLLIVGPKEGPHPADRLRAAGARVRDASPAGTPIVELLGMQASVPRQWRRAPADMSFLTWLGCARLADDLALICAVAASGPERRRQLAAARRLQGALAGWEELGQRQGASDRQWARADARVEACFKAAFDAIGADDLAAISVEAAAIRAGR
jgi:hypothetical protein